MGLVETAAAAISWLGRQGTRAVAALVLIGIALPWIGALLKPYVTEAVFVLLCIAFLRVDIDALKNCLRRPAVALAATAWTSVAVPILFGLGCIAFGLPDQAPELYLSLMLQAVASPMMAAPAFAVLMRLDATLVLVTLIASTVLIPFTAPLFAMVFVGPILSLSPLALGIKLFTILAGAALVGFVARRIMGPAAIMRYKEPIDGINILALFVFMMAIMEGVGARFISAPAGTAAMLVFALAVFLALFFITALLFLPTGRERSLSVAFLVSQRNMGLMLAATAGVVPDLTWLYFALAQFPIYLSPYCFNRWRGGLRR